jgi:anti-anti-sigma regulatory factor
MGDPADDDPEGAHSLLKYEVILDVLVITLLTSGLDDDHGLLKRLIRRLEGLSRRPLPRRVVIHLCCVTSMSVTGFAVLVAYSQRLASRGGELRLSHVVPAVQAVLARFELPRPIGVYLRVDDAVVTRWAKCDRGRVRGRPSLAPVGTGGPRDDQGDARSDRGPAGMADLAGGGAPQVLERV